MVSLRNVNLRSCSKCQFALMPWPRNSGVAWYVDYLRRWDDVSWWRRTGRTARLALRNVRILRSQVHKRVLNAADGCRLWEKKAKKSVHCRHQESDRRTRVQNQKARIGHSSQARYLGSLFTLPLFCTVLWTPTKRATPDTCAMRNDTGAWRGARHHTHA